MNDRRPKNAAALIRNKGQATSGIGRGEERMAMSDVKDDETEQLMQAEQLMAELRNNNALDKISTKPLVAMMQCMTKIETKAVQPPVFVDLNGDMEGADEYVRLIIHMMVERINAKVGNEMVCWFTDEEELSMALGEDGSVEDQRCLVDAMVRLCTTTIKGIHRHEVKAKSALRIMTLFHMVSRMKMRIWVE